MAFRVLAVVLAAFLVTETSAFWFSKPAPKDPMSDDIDQAWSSFKVTFDTNIFTKAFRDFPRDLFDTTDNDTNTGWSRDLNDECTSGGRYAGWRVIKNNDPSANIIVDKNRIIAGIQMNLLKKNLTVPNNVYRFEDDPFFTENTIDGEVYLTLTAYFVHPSTICSTGRTHADLLTVNGTGNALYLQSGPTPQDIVHVPRHKERALKEGWTQNKCFLMMGEHTFYQVDQLDPNNCTIGRPYFILWNKQGEMHGFGFQVQGTVNSDHYEHPPETAVKMILGDTPKCMIDRINKVGLTTMHVYFLDHPAFITCPLF